MNNLFLSGRVARLPVRSAKLRARAARAEFLDAARPGAFHRAALFCDNQQHPRAN